MCRLLFVSGSPAEYEIREILIRFRRLSEYGNIPAGSAKGHKDGWGLVTIGNGRPEKEFRNAGDAFSDPLYVDGVDAIVTSRPRAIMGHLRKAFVGAGTIENTQPYISGAYVMGHNGTVFGAEDFPLEHSKNLIQGESDSERLFYFLVERARDGEACRNDVESAIRDIAAHHDYTAMNLLFFDGRQLLAHRDINMENADVREYDLENYYSLFLGTEPSGRFSVVCSEALPLDGVEWRLLENRETVELPFS
ncbi:MAG: class II glutamine amidotransferase [Candidatus Moranbacteria bacterium]|nr:class II glutamine amidotransferase [Candidatus Moranbacteria bacterium]